MPKYLGDAEHSHARSAKIGILVCNLGTPDAPTPRALRQYLAEFLSDPRLIELPRWLWLPLLHGVILNVRPRRSAHAYAKIWSADGSPLRAWSIRQRDALTAAFATRHPERVEIALGMRYGAPSIASALETLRVAGVHRLLVIPLYPQYSAPATGSVFDAVSRTLQGWRWVPELRFINGYHDDPGYIAALVSSVREHWAAHGRGERLYFSFHGLPQKYFLAGDPYFCQCHATARLVATALGLADTEWQVVFQSRFGRARWLEPYADATLRAGAAQGLRRAEVICPGFAADCLETLEEIALQNRDLFVAAGGTELHYIPALNARPDHISALVALLERHLCGWPELDPNWLEQQAQVAAARTSRARALGAAQ